MDYNTIMLIIAVIGSITASIISIINYFITKKKIISDIIPNFRYDRLKDIKNAIGYFIDIYYEEANHKPDDRIKLKQALFKVELTFNYFNSSTYDGIKKELYKYMESNTPITDHQTLIIETQRILYGIISKAKIEAGITPKIDEKYKKILRKQFSKCEGCYYDCNRQRN